MQSLPQQRVPSFSGQERPRVSGSGTHGCCSAACLHGMKRIASAPSMVELASSRAGSGARARAMGSDAQTSSAHQSRFAPAVTDGQALRREGQVGLQAQRLATESEASTPGAGPVSQAMASAPFASLSRVLLVGQPGSMFRSLANRKWPSAVGPISLLVFLFGTVLALFAAVRGVLVRKVKACKCCKGFGVVRCRLCDGRGTVDWRAKFSYSESCPLCATKRFVTCPDCGGHYHRRLFSHAKGSKVTLESFFPGSGSSTPRTTSVRD
jgi:hypothetical protein